MVREKAYSYGSFAKARRNGFTKLQYERSVNAKARWDSLPTETQQRIITRLQESRVRPTRVQSIAQTYNEIEFKVYGYEDALKGGTGSEVEGVFKYVGDKTFDDISSLRDTLYKVIGEKLKMPAGKLFKNKVNIGLISESKVKVKEFKGETLRGDFANLGIGNTEGYVFRKSLANDLTRFLR